MNGSAERVLPRAAGSGAVHGRRAQQVYESPNSRLAVERKENRSHRAVFAGLGALVALAAAGLWLLWFGRVA